MERLASNTPRDGSGLNDVMEFDRVIRVHEDGGVSDEPGVYAPALDWHSDTWHLDGKGWTLLDGYSGQYGYSGPIMHPSEYIGGRMARDIVSTPGVYVALICSDHGDDPDASEDLDPVGWAVARRDDE